MKSRIREIAKEKNSAEKFAADPEMTTDKIPSRTSLNVGYGTYEDTNGTTDVVGKRSTVALPIK